jgi:hypothetical protein
MTPTATPDDDDPCPLCPDDVDDIVAPEPEGDPCPLCPDGVDDIVIPAITPEPPCALCIDPDFAADPAPLAFEYHTATHCDGHSELNGGLNRVAWIWVEYTTPDGEDVQSPKHWNDSIYVEVPAKWMWFGDWGFFYAYAITFHAMDEDGEEIIAYDTLLSC